MNFRSIVTCIASVVFDNNLLLLFRENVDDAAYGSYYCLVNTVSNTAATVSNTARIELSVRTPSPVAVIKGGAIVNGGRQEGIVNLNGKQA